MFNHSIIKYVAICILTSCCFLLYKKIGRLEVHLENAVKINSEMAARTERVDKIFRLIAEKESVARIKYAHENNNLKEVADEEYYKWADTELPRIVVDSLHEYFVKANNDRPQSAKISTNKSSNPKNI